MNKNSANDLFERAPIPRAYFSLCLPLVVGNIISLIYNMADTYFISGTGNTDLVAGVSLCAPIITLLVAIGDIFGLGGSSLVSRLFGEKRDQEAGRVSSFCFYIGLATGLLAMGLLLIFSSGMLTLLGASDENRVYASQYYHWLVLGSPAIIFQLIPLNLLRTEGMAREGMISTTFGSILNIILDPIFIYGLKLGAAGAAIATVLGNVATDLIMIWYVLFRSKKLSLRLQDVKIPPELIRMVLAIGIPGCTTNIMSTFANTMINRALAPYGSDYLASMGICMKVYMIVIMIMVGFVFGAQPLIGYNYGAKNTERLRAIVRFDILVQLVFSLSAFLLFSLTAPLIMNAFMHNETITAYGSLMLRCLLPAAPFAGIVMVFTTIFQSEGKALPAFLLSFCRQGVIFACCLFLLSHIMGYHGILFATLVADALTAILALLLYRRSS